MWQSKCDVVMQGIILLCVDPDLSLDKLNFTYFFISVEALS